MLHQTFTADLHAKKNDSQTCQNVKVKALTTLFMVAIGS